MLSLVGMRRQAGLCSVLHAWIRLSNARGASSGLSYWSCWESMQRELAGRYH